MTIIIYDNDNNLINPNIFIVIIIISAKLFLGHYSLNLSRNEKLNENLILELHKSQKYSFYLNQIPKIINYLSWIL